MDSEAFAQIQVETPETDTTFAFFGYSLSDDKSTISDLIVAINQVAFFQKDQDYSDLIPVVILHELAEMFFHVSTGSTDDQAAHAYALSEEYRLAFELGVEERYLELIGHWAELLPARSSQIFYQENVGAYQAELSRRQSALYSV